MIVTIWRHGEAGRAATDRQRTLTDNGRDDIGYGSQRFREHCEARSLPAPGLILYSEWLRTTETADLIAGAFTHARCECSPALIPGSRVAQVDALLAQQLEPGDGPEHLVLVSHQPLVSQLVDYYLGERGQVAPLVPGGLATLRLEVPAAACATLLFSAQPPGYEVMS
ncbi:hypothetical protein DWB85_05905 [Seongchinamella sediminis]|uniref:Phosphohistidine phosphatase SixA n=1 Tax=Seongchinamella sediminis TaxID=2283635 RepID=A0A3L7E0D7_9GAMM|nr:hypothetical protein [Seongchinamella sediminis]RLQ22974.1 hypothetical protein DWB85_05905 [Seongchinamella sediminis]